MRSPMIPDSPYPPGVSGAEINDRFGPTRCYWCKRELTPDDPDDVCKQCDEQPNED